MEMVKCGSCEKEIDVSMEIEYSQEINEFFCHPDCATNKYFDCMQSMVFDRTDEEFLKNENVKIVKGKLIKVW
jgi:hypothetical protein